MCWSYAEAGCHLCWEASWPMSGRGSDHRISLHSLDPIQLCSLEVRKCRSTLMHTSDDVIDMICILLFCSEHTWAYAQAPLRAAAKRFQIQTCFSDVEHFSGSAPDILFFYVCFFVEEECIEREGKGIVSRIIFRGTTEQSALWRFPEFLPIKGHTNIYCIYIFIYICISKVQKHS